MTARITLFPPRPQSPAFLPPHNATITPFRKCQPPTASVFAWDEPVMTRQGSVAAGQILAGAQVLTWSGYRTVRAVSVIGQPVAEMTPPPPSGKQGFDPRKLLQVRGDVVEMLAGVPVALVRLADLLGKFGLPCPPRSEQGVAFRFDTPALVLTERGCFASQGHESLPPILSTAEAVTVLTTLRLWFGHVDQ